MDNVSQLESGGVRSSQPAHSEQNSSTMNALNLKTIQPSFLLPNPSLGHYRTKPRNRRRSSHCLCSSNDAGGGGGGDSSSQGGDKRRQEILARIAMLQTQKVRLTDFLDERSAYLTQFAEDANAEFDQIGENALKELDEASARIMEKLESRAQAFEEDAEINRQEIEKNNKVLEEFEEKIERDRNEGLFFKNLREKPAVVPREKVAEAKVEARKLKEATERSAAASKVRGNIYLALMAVLAVTIGNAVAAAPEVEWRKVAALGLIFVGLVAQFVFEKSLSSETEEEERK
ncbi:hypothetical protein Cni_G09431 [Canna indica]|uniref:Uncharacterized protein n=1 Tax=Canna indica TaxID=4628 RepID=A0AAQ3Q9B1_9LILI|nr:hypothetical protein Cni_G09431 [Canna indica]